jgi:hypothetical protein
MDLESIEESLRNLEKGELVRVGESLRSLQCIPYDLSRFPNCQRVCPYRFFNLQTEFSKYELEILINFEFFDMDFRSLKFYLIKFWINFQIQFFLHFLLNLLIVNMK